MHDWGGGGGENGNGYRFKFVSHYNSKNYYCFLKGEDTIRDLIAQFLEIIVGPKYNPSNNYSARIMYKDSV